MSKLRAAVAVAAAKLAASGSRLLRTGGGTSLPGVVALGIDPGVIGRLTPGIARGSVIITGTNGKTTTASMLAAVAKAHKLSPIHNAAGANLSFGVASALIGQTSLGLRVHGDLGIFEIDEATVRNVIRQVGPRAVAVTNVFRDQLDRYGEVDHTARLIGQALEGLSPESILVLNADDPRVAWLGKDRARVVYYGLDDPTQAAGFGGGAQDSKDCPVCGATLNYDVRYLAHLGTYRCPACGLVRPRPSVHARHVRLSVTDSTFELVVDGRVFPLTLRLSGLYNVYNALAAVAIGLALDLPVDGTVAALETFAPPFGRLEQVQVAGRTVHLMLIKNPTGFNEAIRTLNLQREPKNLLVAINDNLADGTDISWLWDVDVENLGPINFTVASGVRAHDMAVRLKYAGFAADSVRVAPGIAEAIDRAVAGTPQGGELFVLPTYTAMLEARQHLEKVGRLKTFWAEAAS